MLARSISDAIDAFNAIPEPIGIPVSDACIIIHATAESRTLIERFIAIPVEAACVIITSIERIT